MTPGTKLHALLSTARVANVPSVVSNLGVGVLLGLMFRGGGFSWPWLLTIAAILFYVGGNFLNDWMDRDWDRIHRPERALPRGQFSPQLYLGVAISSFLIGLAITFFYGQEAFLVGAVLVGLIWLYTAIHKKTPFSVIPMGLCRASLPVLGFLAVGPKFSWMILFSSAALLVYIIGLSMSARGESRPESAHDRRLFARFMLFGSGLIAVYTGVRSHPDTALLALCVFGVWMGFCLTKYRSPVPVHVSALLAGIPLIDLITLLPFAFFATELDLLETSNGWFFTSLLLPPFAFVAGRLLQRLAPAT